MKYVKRVLLGIAVLLLVLLVYGLLEPYWLQMDEESAVIPNLPAAFEGRQIMVVSDFQLGMYLDNDFTVRQAVKRMVDARPAAVVIAGDFVYHAAHSRADEAAYAARIVAPLVEVGIPTYAVLGNHDYSAIRRDDPQIAYDLAEDLKQDLESVGVVVLENQAAELRVGDSTLYLVGIGSWMAHQSNAAQAFDGVPADAARVVFLHNPAGFQNIPARAAPLAVAGHTHCGQIRVPGLPFWSWLELAEQTDAQTAHADGWIISSYGAAGNRLYVTCGIGFSKVPIRIFTRPEVSVFTLQAQ